MPPPHCPGTKLPGGGRWAVARCLWRTEPGAAGGSGCEEGTGGGQGQDLRNGKDGMGEGKACTCLDAEGEGEGEGG